MEAAKGTSKDIKIEPMVNCHACDGSGMKSGTQRENCARCRGTGTRIHFMQGGFQMAATCESCGGAGVVIPKGAECSSCNGNGVAKERKTIRVDIPPGVDDGMRLRVTGEGDAPLASSMGATRTQRGDLHVHIRVAPHESFGRRGADILYTATVPFTTALLGGKVKIPTLDGEVDLKVNSGTNTGDKITIPGAGMKKIEGRRGAMGDLRVEYKINMPKCVFLSCYSPLSPLSPRSI